MKKNTELAIGVIKNNPTFFISLVKQPGYVENWSEKAGMTEQRTQFMKDLQVHFLTGADNFISDEGKKKVEEFQAAFRDVANGKLDLMKDFLEKNQGFAETMIKNGNSDLLSNWRNDHTREDKLAKTKLEIMPLLNLMEQKAEKLRNEGHVDAADAADTFITEIDTNVQDYTNDKINKEDFLEGINSSIEKAEKSELKEHRGFFGNIFHALNKALNILTGGKFEISPTDSIQITHKFKEVVSNIKSEEETPKGEVAPKM